MVRGLELCLGSPQVSAKDIVYVASLNLTHPFLLKSLLPIFIMSTLLIPVLLSPLGRGSSDGWDRIRRCEQRLKEAKAAIAAEAAYTDVFFKKCGFFSRSKI